MSRPSYFDRLRGSVTRIARHAYFPGKDDAVVQCLEEIEHLRDSGRITAQEFAALREILEDPGDVGPLEAAAGGRGSPEVAPERGGVAIVCQGAGSQAAFPAGVLQGLLSGPIARGRICAVGGYHLGAVNALLAWEGLLRGDLGRGVEQLQRFWDEYAAGSLIDTVLNYSCQMLQHLRAAVPFAGLGPPSLAFCAEHLLREQLARQIDFGLLRALAEIDGAPKLAVGRGAGIGERCLGGEEISLEGFLDLLAGPNALQAVEGPLDDDVGRGSVLKMMARARPSEIWLVRITKVGQAGDAPGLARPAAEPRSMEDQLIDMELGFLGTINGLIERGSLIDRRYQRIEVHQIVMEHNLDETSKSDRSPSFIGHLMSYGRERGRQFLERRNGALPRRSRLAVGR